MTTCDVRRYCSRALAAAALTACVTLVTAQQPAQPRVDQAALDRQAEINKRRFVGEDCGLCKDTQWSLQRKQFAEARGSK